MPGFRIYWEWMWQLANAPRLQPQATCQIPYTTSNVIDKPSTTADVPPYAYLVNLQVKEERLIADRAEAVGRNTSGLGTLRSVVDRLWAHGERPALVAIGEEGLKIQTYGEIAEWVLGLGVAGVERGDHVALLAAS